MSPISPLNKSQEESTQLIIVDSDDFVITKQNIQKMYSVLKKNGSLFIISGNKYEGGILQPVFFELAEITKSCNFFLRNSIIWFLPENKFSYNDLFVNRYKTIFHFTKNVGDYFFNKDPVREKHIWEKVEWGKRKKNYNPKGKDPGDVWLKTKDDGNAKIIEHVPLSKESVVERMLLLSSIKNDEIILLLNDKKCQNMCKKHGRKFEN